MLELLKPFKPLTFGFYYVYSHFFKKLINENNKIRCLHKHVFHGTTNIKMHNLKGLCYLSFGIIALHYILLTL